MAHPMGESKRDGLRVDFDRRLKLEFHGSKITSDGGLLAYRELDDALGLTEVAGTIFQDSRTGKNGWHGMTGQFRQSVFGRLGGYEDVNDADRSQLHGIGQRQGAHEVAEVIGQCMQLEPDGIVVELAAGQAGPLDGVLAFLDPLLGGAALIVERESDPISLDTELA